MAPIVHLSSYNLQRGIHYPHLLEQFGSLPELRDADIIAVQEALVPRGGRNTLARLAEDLGAGYRWSYEPVMRYSDKEYGNGFLYRSTVSVRDARRVPLPRVARMGWLARFKTEGGVPDTKSAFVQTFDLCGCRLRIVNLHLDFAGGAEHRVAQLTHLFDMVDTPPGDCHEVDILCGDFNSPKEEHADGTVVAWGQRRGKNGELVNARTRRGQSGDRWPEGERSVLLGLADFDLPDVFRTLHGYEQEAFSWVLRRNTKEFRRRFDHIFASASLGPRRCEYIHEWREAGLSDHSAIEAAFVPKNN